MTDKESDFEAALTGEIASGLYWLNSNLAKDSLERVAGRVDYPFYYVDGTTVTDHDSFFEALTRTFKWPEYAASNLDAIFDVVTEPVYYEPQGKGIILFDECHKLLNADPRLFKIVFAIFRAIPERFGEYMKHHSMEGRQPFQIYTLLRGGDNRFNVATKTYKPISPFIPG